MVCENSPLPLTLKDIEEALKIEGDTFFIELKYTDIEKELQEQKVLYKILESYSVVICFEDDGKRYNDIHTLVSFLHNNSPLSINFRFGIKEVEKLSNDPIKILLSGILPINQLEIQIEEKLYKYIEKNKNKLSKKFLKTREILSEKIGFTILPVKYYPSKDMLPQSIKLINPYTKQTICECKATKKTKNIDKIIEEHLDKLSMAYINLAKM